MTIMRESATRSTVEKATFSSNSIVLLMNDLTGLIQTMLES